MTEEEIYQLRLQNLLLQRQAGELLIQNANLAIAQLEREKPVPAPTPEGGNPDGA